MCSGIWRRAHGWKCPRFEVGVSGLGDWDEDGGTRERNSNMRVVGFDSGMTLDASSGRQSDDRRQTSLFPLLRSNMMNPSPYSQCAKGRT